MRAAVQWRSNCRPYGCTCVVFMRNRADMWMHLMPGTCPDRRKTYAQRRRHKIANGGVPPILQLGNFITLCVCLRFSLWISAISVSWETVLRFFSFYITHMRVIYATPVAGIHLIILQDIYEKMAGSVTLGSPCTSASHVDHMWQPRFM